MGSERGLRGPGRAERRGPGEAGSRQRIEWVRAMYTERATKHGEVALGISSV